MVSCNRITEPCQTVSILDLGNFGKLFISALEEWWVMDVS